MTNRTHLLEELTEENRNVLIRESFLLEQKQRFSDKESAYDTYNQLYNQLNATVTTAIVTAITGSSLSYLLTDHRGGVAVSGMLFLWLSLVSLFSEKIYSMHSALKYVDCLAETTTEIPVVPEGRLIIFILEIATVALFLVGLLLMGISWCVPH